MNFEEKYFSRFNFDQAEIIRQIENASKDLGIAEADKILDVKFNYSYSALIKSGIALLSYFHIKAKSVPGHHVKIIEKLAETLKDDSINDIGNVMRTKRNLDMYSGGIEITEKECREYVEFVKKVLSQVKAILGL